MHRQFCKLLIQNPEYVKIHCNIRNNPFDFACRKWYLGNQTNIKTIYKFI